MDRETKKKLKNQKAKKYALIVLALAVCISVISGFTIEGKDALLADGQGNIVTDNAGDAAAQDQTDAAQQDESEVTSGEEQSDGSKTDSSKDQTDAAQQDESETDPGKAQPDEAQPVTVTLEIRCDTLSSHMEYLENPSIEEYIPEDGTILAKTTYSGTSENTVFDVLNTLTRNNGIALDFRFTPMYESYYISGINYLYEFDGGPQSGWMYKVNDWFPNYGCSSYYLSDGDEIVWLYTCRGLGEDVGSPAWME